MIRERYRCINRTGQCAVASRVEVADRFWSRLRGLLGTKVLAAGEGLWITPCRQVHTFFMAYPIRVVFLDARDRVIDVIPLLPPWRISRYCGQARSVLELSPASPPDAVKRDDVLALLAGGGIAGIHDGR